MKANERQDFSELLRGISEVYGNAMGANGLEIWWRVLADYPLAQVRAALSAHVQDPTTGKFAPKPADIIGRIQALDGRPGVEEAWSMIPRDERTTAVVTTEMMVALGVAQSLLDEGDQVAARMAFREAYQSAVQAARANRQPVHWFPSLGSDAWGRDAPLLDAARKGRLSIEHVKALLPIPEQSTVILESIKARALADKSHA